MKTKAHHIASVGLALPVSLLMHYATGDGMTAIMTGIGCVLGVWFSPDLDLGENRKARVKNFLWIWLWFPYAKAIKHRSFWSHFPVVGTAVRVAYLFGVLAALAWMLDLLWLAALVPWRMMAWGLVGLCVSDMAHWVLDII